MTGSTQDCPSEPCSGVAALFANGSNVASVHAWTSAICSMHGVNCIDQRFNVALWDMCQAEAQVLPLLPSCCRCCLPAGGSKPKAQGCPEGLAGG